MIFRKQAMIYDVVDLLSAIFFIAIGLVLTLIIIMGKRVETVDHKFVIEENLEIVDEFMIFLSLPLNQFDYSNFKSSSFSDDSFFEDYKDGLSVYHLFSLMYTDILAYQMLTYLLEEHPVLSLYQIHLPSPDFIIYQSISSLDDNSLMFIPSYNKYMSYDYVSTISSHFSICGLGKSLKRVRFSLPFYYNDKSLSDVFEIRYCHKTKYFEAV